MSRQFLALAAMLAALGQTRGADAPRPPNVLVVITDDQGFGDLGCHGNPVIKTPNLDAFARQSVWLKNFYVCPVCSPTRSGLLTGRYNYRTGIVDTALGRSMMRPDEVTLAQMLAGAGYRTGLFGKWHLGDNYPLRPEDRGFQETLWLQGGGLAQPSDPPAQDPKSAYFDPILKKNGKEVKTKGYCTDVITDAAREFITAESARPFFAYVAFNAPHSPFQVPESFAAPYKKLDLSADGFPKVGQPWATPKLNTEDIANAYGMIENIDTNFARLLQALAEKGLTENTIVIFLTDNGPGGVRFNSGLRNRKGSVYEGGFRVPCYIRWPAAVKGGWAIDTPLAHIDVTPTLVEACRVEWKGGPPAFDGRSFLRILAGAPENWPGRTLFFQWHRGDAPEKYRSCAARGPRYKLVQANGVPEGAKWQPKFELFDLADDPFETKDLAADKPEELARLKKQYEAWFDDVTKKGFDPARIVVGSEKENPVRLSRQDWRGPKAGWTPESIGHWEVKVARAGKYRVTLISKAEFQDHELHVGGLAQGGTNTAMRKTLTVEAELSAGDATVSAKVGAGGAWRGVDYLELESVGK
ncbi:MAG TPA: arylsulfatase [Gemmataceae bacterium]|nr:arylsulfatase [Gemmataceae bacterium]